MFFRPVGEGLEGRSMLASLALTAVGGTSGSETNMNHFVEFRAELTGAVEGGFNVSYFTADGTATGIDTSTAFHDYTDESGTFEFAGTDGEVHDFSVWIRGESVVELNETFLVALHDLLLLGPPGGGDPSTVTLPDEVTYTINNDDSAVITVTPYSDGWDEDILASPSGAKFDVTLSNQVDVDVTFTYRTVNGTAISGEDYTGVTTATAEFDSYDYYSFIYIPVSPDTKVEADETFTFVVLTHSPAGRNVTLAAGTSAETTIANDDHAKVKLVYDAAGTSKAEGSGSFTVTAQLVIVGGSMDGTPTTSDQDVVVPITTSDGTAKDGGTGVGDNDYNGYPSGTNITIAAGSTSQAVSIGINSDNVVEANQTFTVTPGTPNVNGRNIDNAVGSATTHTILNDDGVATFSISDEEITVAAAIGGWTDVSFVVTMSNPLDHDVTLAVTNHDGTATQPLHYLVLTPTITFTAGSTSQTVRVRAFSGDRSTPLEFEIGLSLLTSDSSVSVDSNTRGKGTIKN